MTIDQALKNALSILDSVLIPASETAKIENVKISVRGVIEAVESTRTAKQHDSDKNQEERHED